MRYFVIWWMVIVKWKNPNFLPRRWYQKVSPKIGTVYRCTQYDRTSTDTNLIISDVVCYIKNQYKSYATYIVSAVHYGVRAVCDVSSVHFTTVYEQPAMYR